MPAAPLDPTRRRRHKLRNLIQSVVLLGGMTGLLAACAWIVVGPEGMVWIALGAGLALALGPRVSPRLVLALYRARALSPYEFPAGYEVLDLLARRAGLARPPRLYYVPSAMLNAFAVGDREASAIAVTDGMLRAFNLRELAGVLAHELSHIRNNDLWIMNLADSISRLTIFMAYAGMLLILVGLPLLIAERGSVPWLLVLLLVLSPTLANLLQLALSRAREFDADLDAAGLTGDPAGLASALQKLELAQGSLWERVVLPGRRIPNPSLLRSHPATEERIRRLLELYPAEPRRVLGAEAPLHIPGHLARIQRRPRHHLTGAWF